MQLRFLLLPLLVVVSAQAVRAEAIAPSGPPSRCVTASVDTLRASDSGHALYRIVFLNRCELPRSLYWCAEHSGVPVPATVACAAQNEAGGELRHVIRYRKEFQWHLPQGVRVRFQDCPRGEIANADFSCSPATAARR